MWRQGGASVFGDVGIFGEVGLGVAGFGCHLGLLLCS